MASALKVVLSVSILPAVKFRLRFISEYASIMNFAPVPPERLSVPLPIIFSLPKLIVPAVNELILMVLPDASSDL